MRYFFNVRANRFGGSADRCFSRCPTAIASTITGRVFKGVNLLVYVPIGIFSLHFGQVEHTHSTNVLSGCLISLNTAFGVWALDHWVMYHRLSFWQLWSRWQRKE